ncbi:integrase [Gossypium australe]|uniref:Integrase n=1 Tax=Gossypium australe TaxID=47621 RepID=A0A5B6W5U0_9ROSI|nr:integrase [Gossypium australe]
MNSDLEQMYWWSGMKCEISEFVSKYLIFQQVKAKHQVPSGLLQHVMISEWKWEWVTMDFLSMLLLSLRKKDVIWVVVGHLTKSAHFILVRTGYSLEKLTELYVADITDDRSKQVIQILEDMLHFVFLSSRVAGKNFFR